MADNLVDLKIEIDENGIPDLVFQDGGIAIDDTLESAVFIEIFTNLYENNYPLDKREGNISGDFGSFTWKYLQHKVFDFETISYIRSSINTALDKFVQLGVWTRHNTIIDILSAGFITITIECFNATGNETNKFYFKFKNSI